MNQDNFSYVFLNLTSNSQHYEEEAGAFFSSSTHDLAEKMLYAYVDNNPSVADLLWSKQQLQQGEFLKLTDGQEWDQAPVSSFSTHEPYKDFF
ncbi:MAG: hypothetical protein EXX96DRAFT_164534 [Benjaminiella poitrasii]|nr:MAG: hypothetical protein EXX96DRAFT_164534 [Benjaminiella poitrasii]